MLILIGRWRNIHSIFLNNYFESSYYKQKKNVKHGKFTITIQNQMLIVHHFIYIVLIQKGKVTDAYI